MKDRKASLNLYSPCDWKAVERHLTRMAAKGWRLSMWAMPAGITAGRRPPRCTMR